MGGGQSEEIRNKGVKERRKEGRTKSRQERRGKMGREEVKQKVNYGGRKEEGK